MVKLNLALHLAAGNQLVPVVLGIQIHQVEDSLRACQGTLQDVELFRKIVDRLKQLLDIGGESHQQADCDGVAQNLPATVPDDQRHGNLRANVDDRTEEGKELHLPDRGLIVFLVDIRKLLPLMEILVEKLDYLLSADVLRQSRIERRQILPHFAVDHPRAPAVFADHQNHERQDDKADQRELPVEGQHQRHDCHDEDHILHQGDHAGGQHFVDGPDIVGYPGHQPAHGVLVEILHRHALQMGKHVMAQVVHRPLGEGGGDHALGIARRQAQKADHKVDQSQPDQTVGRLAAHLDAFNSRDPVEVFPHHADLAAAQADPALQALFVAPGAGVLAQILVQDCPVGDCIFQQKDLSAAQYAFILQIFKVSPVDLILVVGAEDQKILPVLCIFLEFENLILGLESVYLRFQVEDRDQFVRDYMVVDRAALDEGLDKFSRRHHHQDQKGYHHPKQIGFEIQEQLAIEAFVVDFAFQLVFREAAPSASAAATEVHSSSPSSLARILCFS